MLAVQHISKSFGTKTALEGVSFEVQPGEIVAVVGPSGCGKSTLLNIIAGLERADEGQVTWDGISVADAPPYRRGFGLMFQDFALFPHQNVFENVAFGLRMQRQPLEQIRLQVQAALELVGLPGIEKRDVNTLSGGEQQRVALARALAPHPRLLMLDEPLGSLDRSLRERLVLDLRQILQRSHQTALYVTHDQEEAFTLADRLVVMNAGRIEQIGVPEQVYCAPVSVFVARFLGLNNLLPGVIVGADLAGVEVQTSAGSFYLPGLFARRPGEAVTLLLRPDAVQLDQKASQSLPGILRESIFRGGMLRAMVEVHGQLLTFDFPSRTLLPEVGQAILLSFEPEQALQVFSL